MKRNFVFLFALLVSFVWMGSAAAQSQSKVTMQVVDTTSREPILGAMVELLPRDTVNSRVRYTSTDYKGNATFGSVTFEQYTIRISLIGYTTKQVELKVDKAQYPMGIIALAESTQDIEQINFTAHAMRTSQRGDTLAYNADAFKVTRDADTEALLSKMPGIKVSDGTVEAQGEQVKRVLVDGRELFGEDVSAAIKNIPAEAVKNVEVFDKKSDQAEFTGVDDGEDYKAINIVTRPGMRNGVFGKISASYIPEDRYSVGASLNAFKEERKISFTAYSNNINQQNFSTDDMLGVVSGGGRGPGHGKGGPSNMTSSQSGISDRNSLSLSYSEKFSEKISATASYSFNSTANLLDKNIQRQYTVNADSLQNYQSDLYSESDNYNHRFDAMLDWNINENNMLMFRPNFSYQDYSSYSDSYGGNYIVAGSESIDQNTFTENSDQDKNAYSLRNTLIYRHKFNDTGRSVMMFANGSISDNNSDQLSDSYTRYLLPTESQENINQTTVSNTSSYSYKARVSYMEPLAQRTYLMTTYNFSNSYSDIDKRAYMYNVETGGYDDFNAKLSNTYNSSYTTHSVGPGVHFSNDMTNFVAEATYQYSMLDGEQTYPVIASPVTDKTYSNLTYFAMMRHQFNNQTSLRFMLRSNTNTPSITQLQDVIDLTNPLFISSGNSALRPTYNNSLKMNFTKSNVMKGRTLMFMLSADLTNNYIGQDLTIAGKDGLVLDNGVTLNNGAQFTKPVNLDGYQKYRAKVDYGLPVGFIRSNLNVDLGASYTQLPSLINGQTNRTQTFSYEGGAVLGSNISERVDFTLSYDGAYNIAKNSILSKSDNTYLSHKASLRMKLEAWWGITLSVNGSYNQYKGITDDYNEQYTLLNVSLGKKVFYNRRGEISIGVNDVFNQNTSFVRNVTDTYIENVTSNVLGRMFNISFTYNLRTYSK